MSDLHAFLFDFQIMVDGRPLRTRDIQRGKTFEDALWKFYRSYHDSLVGTPNLPVFSDPEALAHWVKCSTATPISGCIQLPDSGLEAMDVTLRETYRDLPIRGFPPSPEEFPHQKRWLVSTTGAYKDGEKIHRCIVLWVGYTTAMVVPIACKTELLQTPKEILKAQIISV